MVESVKQADVLMYCRAFYAVNLSLPLWLLSSAWIETLCSDRYKLREMRSNLLGR